MSQHDMNIDNGPGLAVRTDMNAAIQALASNNSGATEPATMYPGMFWLDTSVAPNGAVRMRNQANDGWIFLFNVVPGSPPSMTVSPTSDMATGYRTGPNRWAINDKADLTGNDVFVVTESGILTARQPDGTMQRIRLASAPEPNIIVNPMAHVSQENGNGVGTAHNYWFADNWALQGVGIAMGGRSNLDAGKPYGQIHNTAVDTPAAGDFLCMTLPIEGHNWQGLGWGLATEWRRPAVLNFKARATAVGTYGGAVKEQNGAGYSFPFTFAITAANVWQEFTIAIPAPPAGATGFATAGPAVGGLLQFVHTTGTTYVAPTEKLWQVGNFFAAPGITNNSAVISTLLQITDVQLLADPDGSGAAPKFVPPNFEEVLAACQRYYQADFNGISITGGNTPGPGTFYADHNFVVPLRATPTMTIANSAASNVNNAAFSVGSVTGFRWFVIAQAAGSWYCAINWIAKARLF